MDKNVVRHWVWAAYTEDENLIYGCLVHAVEKWAVLLDSPTTFELNFEGIKVTIIQDLLTTVDAELITHKLRTKNVLDLHTIPDTPTFEIKASRKRLLDAFGRIARPTETLVVNQVMKLPEAAWLKIIQYMVSEIGINHLQSPDRLGAFDVYDQSSFAPEEPPITFSAYRDEGDDRKSHTDSFTLGHLSSFNGTLSIVVELSLGEDRVHSQLVTLSCNSEQLTKMKASPFDKYRMLVFDEAGSMVQFEEYSLLTTIGFNMALGGQAQTVNDSLTESAKGLGKEVFEQASTVNKKSTSRSVVGISNVAFDEHRVQMRALARNLAPLNGDDMWFPKGVKHEVDVINHLNKLLDGGTTKSAIIVDPFFSAAASLRILRRLESSDVKLTIVTSLTATDPDTNTSEENPLQKLRDTLNQLNNADNAKRTEHLRVVNLVDRTQQAFHDRYLCLTPHEGDREVYILSNSFNKMAGRWPFCMSKLDTKVAREVIRYIDELANGRDISGSTKPITNLDWPHDE